MVPPAHDPGAKARVDAGPIVGPSVVQMSESLSLPSPVRRMPVARSRTHPIVSAARVISLVIGTFALLAGGVWATSKATCKDPCRLDGSLPRLASLGSKPKVPSAPEDNTALPGRAGAVERHAIDVAPTVQPSPIQLRPAPATVPRPAVGMRTDLPPAPVRRDERWKEPLYRGGSSR